MNKKEDAYLRAMKMFLLSVVATDQRTQMTMMMIEKLANAQGAQGLYVAMLLSLSRLISGKFSEAMPNRPDLQRLDELIDKMNEICEEAVPLIKSAKLGKTIKASLLNSLGMTDDDEEDDDEDGDNDDEDEQKFANEFMQRFIQKKEDVESGHQVTDEALTPSENEQLDELLAQLNKFVVDTNKDINGSTDPDDDPQVEE